MTAWLLRRVAAATAIVFAVVTLVFLLVHLAPGRPFEGSERVLDPAAWETMRERFCLDCPLHRQYTTYLAALAHGDFGISYSQRRPVAQVLADAIPPTLLLSGAALALDFLLGLSIGVYQALRRNRLGDVALGQVTLFLYSVPTFWLGLALVLVFAVWLGWFPAAGMRSPALPTSAPWLVRALDVAWHLTLPAVTLGLVAAAGTARYQRAAMLEVLEQDFIRTARAKGASERRVVLRHAFRNALLPVITLLGMSFPILLTGAVLIETVFSWPGMGRLAAEAVFRRDYPVVTATALVAAAMVVLGNLLADLLYTVADPRIRVREA
ncbi:MAG TPA: ABC transporter permease [Gemmatimonadales bacterium]|nr:ABC transporter permease [Gemmatimonadales bacterium]